MQYKICPECGDHLDFGEICDCRMTTKKEEADLLAQIRPQAQKPTASLSAEKLYVKELITRKTLR